MTPVERTIRDADISTHFETQKGDCGSIALAIRDVFGGELVGVYNSPRQTGPSHVAVRIDGALYDGDGRTSLPVLYGRFVLQNITPEEDEKRVHRQSIESPSELEHSQSVREAVEERLRDALE